MNMKRFILDLFDSSGANSPHAHCNLRDITNGKKISVPFDFSAQ